MCVLRHYFCNLNALLVIFCPLFFVTMEISTNILQRTHFLWYDFNKRHGRFVQHGRLHHRLVVAMFLIPACWHHLILSQESRWLSTAQAFQYQGVDQHRFSSVTPKHRYWNCGEIYPLLPSTQKLRFTVCKHWPQYCMHWSPSTTLHPE